MSDGAVRLRPATADDAVAIRPIAARLASTGERPWRSVPGMVQAYTALILDAIGKENDDEAVIVAEREGRVVGVLYLQTLADMVGKTRHGHVCDLAVAEEAEGSGVARALLDEAERWSRGRGHPYLTLNVFAENARAIAVYERLGFRADWVRFTRPLGDAR